MFEIRAEWMCARGNLVRLRSLFNLCRRILLFPFLTRSLDISQISWVNNRRTTKGHRWERKCWLLWLLLWRLVVWMVVVSVWTFWCNTPAVTIIVIAYIYIRSAFDKQALNGQSYIALIFCASTLSYILPGRFFFDFTGGITSYFDPVGLSTSLLNLHRKMKLYADAAEAHSFNIL